MNERTAGNFLSLRQYDKRVLSDQRIKLLRMPYVSSNATTGLVSFDMLFLEIFKVIYRGDINLAIKKATPVMPDLIRDLP